MILKLAVSTDWNFGRKLSLLPDHHYLGPVKRALQEIHTSARQAIKSPNNVKHFYIDDLHKAQSALRNEFDKLGPGHERTIKAMLTRKRK